MSRDIDQFLSLIDEEGIGALNEQETAMEREIAALEKAITVFVDDAGIKIAATYPDEPDEKREDLLEWIEYAIPGDAPELYMDGGYAAKYADRVLPELYLKDESSRDHWDAYWEIVHKHRCMIDGLNGRLSVLRRARTLYLFSEDNTGSDATTPETEAEHVFDGKTRMTGEKSHVHQDVKDWAQAAHLHFYRNKGMSVEDAKDRVLGIAERNDYYFDRRSLERWIGP
jgi:hypothetical protein